MFEVLPTGFQSLLFHDILFPVKDMCLLQYVYYQTFYLIFIYYTVNQIPQHFDVWTMMKNFISIYVYL